MTAPMEEFDQPCPHGGSVVTCDNCLAEFVTAERLVESAGGGTHNALRADGPWVHHIICYCQIGHDHWARP